MLRPALAMIALSLAIVAIVASARTPEPAARPEPVVAQESPHPTSTGILCTCEVECTGAGIFFFGRNSHATLACTNAMSSCTASGCTTCEQIDLICE